jgi:hypothetical protein
MKTTASLLFALTFCFTPVLAGSFGPGPWANGAYYPGQFDGLYSATAIGTNTSGVIAFGLTNGTPTILTNLATSNVAVNPFQNYWLVFVQGQTYAGATLATINNNSKTVAGALFSQPATASGGFSANITSDKALITFVGNNTGKLTVNAGGGGGGGGAPGTNIFSVNGLKVGNLP